MNIFPNRNTWIQILFWGTLWVLIPFLLTNNWEYSERHLVRSIVVFIGIVVVIWTNGVWLMPSFYFKKKHLSYFIAALLLLTVVLLLVAWDHAPWAEYMSRMGGSGRKRPENFKPNPSFQFMRYFSMAIPYFTALIGSALFEVVSFANKKEKEAAEFRSEKLSAELMFLKSQTNPHFLFNALNNIYTLTVLKSDQAPDNLLKLSGMLRYMLYECKADRVPLEKELEYIKNFTDLYLLKDSRGLNVKTQLDTSRPELPISPMLLIPFVENAFKHSKIEDIEHGWITIDLTAKDDTLQFVVANSKPETAGSKDQQGGIGLQNVQRQLELLYPENHSLEILDESDRYQVTLKIKLT